MCNYNISHENYNLEGTVLLSQSVCCLINFTVQTVCSKDFSTNGPVPKNEKSRTVRTVLAVRGPDRKLQSFLFGQSRRSAVRTVRTVLAVRGLDRPDGPGGPRSGPSGRSWQSAVRTVRTVLAVRGLDGLDGPDGPRTVRS